VLFIFTGLERHASRSLACQNRPRDSGDTIVCALQVFNVKTLWVKFVSCAAAVGSGLPVGPEGPMIHIGAMIGAALSQGQSTSLGFTTGLFKRFQNPKDKRDFVTAGK
jgi:H+/Cl- antiporter ClcA